MKMGCTNCRKNFLFDEMVIFDGMFVCMDCFNKFEEEKEKSKGVINMLWTLWTIKQGTINGYGDVWDVFNEEGNWVACFEEKADANDFINLMEGVE